MSEASWAKINHLKLYVLSVVDLISMFEARWWDINHHHERKRQLKQENIWTGYKWTGWMCRRSYVLAGGALAFGGAWTGAEFDRRSRGNETRWKVSLSFWGDVSPSNTLSRRALKAHVVMRQIEISSERQWDAVIDKREKIQVTEHPVVGGRWVGLEILERCQLYLLFCQQTMAAELSRREAQNTEWEQTRNRHSSAMSSVSTVLGKTRRDRSEAVHKKKNPFWPDMCSVELLFTEREEGYWQILLIATGRECSVCSACCAGTVCLCGSTEAIWRSSEFREILPHHPKPEELMYWEGPGGARLAVAFYELRLM